MNGYGNHSFRVVNEEGRAHYVKFHVKTDVSEKRTAQPVHIGR